MSRQSSKSLGSLEGSFKRERIFLIGNGPSLSETPMEALSGEYSLAMNAINHIYDETEWRPTFYLLCEGGFVQTKREFVEEHIDIGVTCFLNRKTQDAIGEQENVYYFNRQELKEQPARTKDGLHKMDIESVEKLPLGHLYDFWSQDIREIVYTYHSMYGAYQIATYLGFNEIYLVGCDLGYEVSSPHMIFDTGIDPLNYVPKMRYIRDSYDENVLLQSVINGITYKMFNSPLEGLMSSVAKHTDTMQDANHFDPNYWLKPKDNRYANREITKSHKVAKRITANQGIDVYNATVGGDLEVFPRVNIKDITSYEA